MAEAQLVVAADATRQPWRNGGGTTRELLAWPGREGWRVRLSVADIERDGPFSSYPGVARWFAVLKGAGVELSIDGKLQRMTRNDAPLCFSGAAATQCRLLDGPTEDLNLMLHGVRGALRLVEDGADANARGLFTAVAGRCLADGVEAALPAYALLWFDAAPAAPLRFVADARPAGATGWWIEVDAQEQP